MTKNLQFKSLFVILLTMLLLSNFSSCRSESTNSEEIKLSFFKNSIQRKSLSELPDILPILSEVKAKAIHNGVLKKAKKNNAQSKYVEDFEIDEENILVLDLPNEGQLISMIVNDQTLDESYSVTNLNIVRNYGVDSYFITRYNPTDGKPFYNYADFTGTIQYLDLDGNILSSFYANMSEEISITIGCSMLLISGCSCDGNWELVGIFDVCGGGGGVPNSGTEGGSNGGYTPGEGGGGGGGTGGTTTQPNIPNIPSEDVVHVKRYKSFLTVQLTQEEVDVLISNQNLSDHIFEYLSAEENNFSPASMSNAKWFMNFYTQTLKTDPNIDPFIYFDTGSKFMDENTGIVNPENVFLRMYALDQFLKINPDGLLDISCYELQKWHEIANHKIPQNVKTKLQNIKNQGWLNNWDITTIDDATGASLNMDLFPVKINTLPINPNTGNKYTPAEFFDYFRKNLSDFAPTFTPIEDNYYNIHDTALWNSSNPLGALIHINILGDNGTVVCSGVSTNTWIFTTIKAPFSWSYDGIHPVAGNRAFSYYMEGTTMYLYTRGVDRVSKNTPVANGITGLANYIIDQAAFYFADQLWTGMQDKVSLFVNSRGGSANKVTVAPYRPNFNKIIGYLKGNQPLSSLGCH